MSEQISTHVDRDEPFVFEEVENVPAKATSYFDNPSGMSQVLRVLGSTIIVAAASIFLFQRWGGSSDIQRYFLLLSFTGVLSVGGFFCGIRLGESKGARTLLGLTLGVTPINFAVIGGLIYSQFAWGMVRHAFPAYASWVAPSATAALGAAAAGLAVLGPLCYLAFLSLSRDHAKILSGAFLAGNLALWIPVRHPGVIGAVMAVLAFGLCYLELRNFQHVPALSTFEGRLSRLLLWVPPAFLVGRALHLYSPSNLFMGFLLAVVAVMGFLFLPTVTKQSRFKGVIQGLSMVPAAASWLYFANVIHTSLRLAANATIPLVALPMAAILMTASFFASSCGTWYRRSAVVIALAGTSFNLVAYPGVFASFICLTTAAAVLIYGFMAEQKVVFFSGAGGVLFGLGYHFKFALKYYSLFNWSSLAVIGVSIIIVASILERHQPQLRQKINAFRNRVQNWGE